MPIIPKVAQEYQEFYEAKTNLEALQDFKLPLNKIFDKMVCGIGDISYLKGESEFNFISPTEEKDEKRIQKKFDKLDDCIDKEIADTFYYLAKLLEHKEETLKLHYNRFFK